MIQGLLIALVAVTLAHDGLRRIPLVPDLPPWVVVTASLAPLLALALIAHIVSMLAGRALDRGRWRAVAFAEHTIGWARALAVASHVLSIVVLGWLDLVRSWLGGNLIFLDEAIVTLAPVLVFVAGWWSYYPIERRLREATILRRLDTADPSQSSLERIPTRWQHLSEQTRHHLLLILLPISLIALWTEGIDTLLENLRGATPRLGQRGAEALAVTLHFAGALTVLALMPLVLRALWDTVPLGAGAMRDRLVALCNAEGVRCRNLLVWRTRSGMLNGALVGFLPLLRYILLTDALLERLPGSEIEAVMAHEVAHARRRHLPWLMIALLASVGSGWTLSWKAFEATLGPERLTADTPMSGVAALTSLAVAVAFGLIAFGFVSRRFEEQADAFATQHLSGWTRASRDRCDIQIAPHAVQAMTGALARVAAYNHIPAHRFSWRHGSIRSRQKRLSRLPGLAAHALPIDASVRIIKGLSFAALTAVIIIVALDPALAPF